MPNNFSVLLVEDDDDARSNMEDLFSLDGYQVESVSHCLPAIQAIEQRPFDAVIVDWRLPDGNGGDLIEAIKGELPDTPVIVITGQREFATAVSALRRGAYDFLTKPINPEALRSLVRRLVERKRHLSEIEGAQEKLLAKERLAAIGQMVAGLAHESRNAFQRSHACLAELSLDLQAMPDSLKLVEKIQRALDDLHRLLEEVREYSAPIILERREASGASLIQQVWDEILTARPNVDVTIQVDVSSNFPGAIFVDTDRMRQVLRNLLENGIFASEVDGRLLVELFCRESGTHEHTKHPKSLCIQISDNGCGIPDDQREQVFVPFFTTKTKGTGLGLAISQRIVEAHGGKLEVSDAPGGGARFTIDLPIEPNTRH